MVKFIINFFYFVIKSINYVRPIPRRHGLVHNISKQHRKQKNTSIKTSLESPKTNKRST